MLAVEQGIEVLSLSPWMYIVLLITAVLGMFSAILALYQSIKNGHNVVRLEATVNGRLSQLLAKTEEAAQALGHGSGVAAERKRIVEEVIEERQRAADVMAAAVAAAAVVATTAATTAATAAALATLVPKSEKE